MSRWVSASPNGVEDAEAHMIYNLLEGAVKRHVMRTLYPRRLFFLRSCYMSASVVHSSG